jgi:hypothetical protein
MKRILSTALAIALLLSLGGLAVLARGGGSILTPVGSVVAAAPQPQTAAAPDATASANYNMVTLPLDIRTTWANSTPVIPFTAQGLAQYVGLSSVDQVLRWDPTRQAYDQWFPGGGFGYVGGIRTKTPYGLATGGVYLLLLNNTNLALTSVSFVGDVPPSSSIKFTLHGAASCQYNVISIPLEQNTLTTATALANSMGGAANVSQVLRWDASRQAYDQWFPGGGFGYVGGARVTTPWSVSIGYPYLVCLFAGADNVLWP